MHDVADSVDTEDRGTQPARKNAPQQPHQPQSLPIDPPPNRRSVEKLIICFERAASAHACGWYGRSAKQCLTWMKTQQFSKIEVIKNLVIGAFWYMLVLQPRNRHEQHQTTPRFTQCAGSAWSHRKRRRYGMRSPVQSGLLAIGSQHPALDDKRGLRGGVGFRHGADAAHTVPPQPLPYPVEDSRV
eukprot:2691502-Rhodomonas_salina.2